MFLQEKVRGPAGVSPGADAVRWKCCLLFVSLSASAIPRCQCSRPSIFKAKKILQGNATCQQLDVGMLEDRSNRAVVIKGMSLLYQKGTVGRESSQANRALCLLAIGTFVHSLTHRSFVDSSFMQQVDFEHRQCIELHSGDIRKTASNSQSRGGGNS